MTFMTTYMTLIGHIIKIELNANDIILVVNHRDDPIAVGDTIANSVTVIVSDTLAQ